MLKKIQSIKVLTTGQGKNGPWTLVEATFEGQEGVYKGFYYDKPLNVGQEVEVEFSTEEYKGNLENRFKLFGKKAMEQKMGEMAIKTEVARYGQEILRKLDLILKNMDVKDHVAEVERIRNMEPMTPTWETDELKKEDVPF
jgi:hypothetical protein